MAIFSLVACQNEPTVIAQKMAPQNLPSIIRKPIRLPDYQNTKFTGHIDDLRGVWVRKDLMHTLKTTRSWFETKQIIEAKSDVNFLAMSIETHRKPDSLLVCTSTFGTQMPTTFYLPCDQLATNKGYKAASDYYKFVLYLKPVGSELMVTAKSGSTTQKLVFQKRAHLKPGCYNQVKMINDIPLRGRYQLLNAQKEYVQDVWFDAWGRTNMPGFERYDMFIGYWNSIHFALDVYQKNEQEIQALRAKGAIDKEDFLTLRFPKIPGEKYDEQKSRREAFVIEKTPNGFKIYQAGGKLAKWSLSYKKSLKYYLIQS